LFAIAPPCAAHAELEIVATVPDLAALAKAIGGDAAEVAAIALPTQDPHFVETKPHLALELSKADLVLVHGLDLEMGWLPALISGSKNRAIQPGSSGYLDCSTLASKLEVRTEKIDRSRGDVHPEGNPHYLYDPREAAKVARGIAERMTLLDGARGPIYRKNLERFLAELEAKRRVWEEALSPIARTKALAYHRSFPYLASWLGFELVGHLEPRPGVPPSPSHVASMTTLAKTQGVKLILQESYYPDTTSRVVAQKSGAELVVIHGGTDFIGGESYVEHVSEIVKAIEAAWKRAQK
jgi:zinc/manganese transport system substrate-binding protein